MNNGVIASDPLDSWRARAARLRRRYTPAQAGSVRHLGLMCSVLSAVLISLFLLTYALVAPGMGAALGSAMAAMLLGAIALHGAMFVGFYLSDGAAIRRLWWLSWSSIAASGALVAGISILMWGRDNEFYVLMIVPVLQAAILFDAGGAALVTLASIFLNFLGAFPMDADEWAEAGAGSLIFTLVAIVVWMLVNSLRDRECRLKRNLEELALTREKLLAEEKLAAVGRLASAIAHEIRNPIAMISSSLMTARFNGHSESERQRLFDIASSEASRLERLTGDFLAYARARELSLARAQVLDMLQYVAAIARAHPGNPGVTIAVEAQPWTQAEFDPTQLQQALLNIAMNAVEACRPGDTVTLRAESRPGAVAFHVIDPGGPIAPQITARIFEPFFTTKPHGTGLGLAIARNVARAHGGDLNLTVNQPGCVCFSIEIPQRESSRRQAS